MNNDFLHNDSELLLGIRHNDEKALACIMRKYYTGLYRFSLQFTRDEKLIKNCIHDVFVSLWKGRSLADKIISLQPYLFRNTKGKLIQYIGEQEDIVYPNLNLYAY